MAKRRYSNALYRIEFTDTGDDIWEGNTYREAMAALKKFEKEDMKEGEYTPGFYTISRFTSVAKGSYYEPVYNSKYGEYGYRPTRKVVKKKTAKKTVAKKKTTAKKRN